MKITKSKLFISILILLSGLGALASQCSDLIGSCEYYQCLENQENCGEDSYYIEFGLHYCRKYQAKEYKYTEQGKEFLTNIRTCLQEELEREIVRAGELPKCSKVEKFAVETHKTCYRKYDFCGLPDDDRRHVKLAAKKEIFDVKMLKFAIWLEKYCH